MITSLIDRNDLAQEEEDYLDVLGDLVGNYEDEHHPLPPLSEDAMLQHFLDTRGVSQAAVAAATGISKTTLSLLLAGKRRMTRKHIETLSRYFKVEPSLFLD